MPRLPFVRSLLALVLVLSGGRLPAQTVEPAKAADRPPAPAPKVAPRERKLPWRGTTLNWAHRATAQTLGLGEDYQSANPYYEWFFSFRPRYYLWEGGDDTLSLRASFNAATELTNSDTTTKRGEFLIDDASLTLVSSFTLAKDGDYKTLFSLSAPRFIVPTSKASRAAGIYTELGGRVFLEQAFPLRSGESFLPRGSFGLRTGYGYLFSRSIVPEDTDLNRVRRDIQGRSASNDQLGGAALSQHRALFRLALSLDLWKDVLSFGTEGGVDPFWKYPLPAGDELAGPTGPVPLDSEGNGRSQVVTYFNAEVSAKALGDVLRVGVGYDNVASQLGPDGRRRSLFYSRAAVLYLGLELSLDALYLEAAGDRPSMVGSAR